MTSRIPSLLLAAAAVCAITRSCAAGRDPVVRASYAGDGIDFALVPASPAELQEFRAPVTPWRIEASPLLEQSAAHRLGDGRGAVAHT
jgi:hypothetical protein